MSVDLKPHNQAGYDNVVEMYKTKNRAAIIHPTGTGKSYIAIKLTEDNQDKKVLFLSSSNPVLHQFKENVIATEGKMFSNLKRMTYQKLARLSDEEFEKLNPDIVVLDEFHHCGAEVWGEAVQNLIDTYPNAKILGLSATPIRYFDGNVDMAEELFEDAIASEISFEEALERDILPKFDYVSALYGYEDSLARLQEIIEDKTGKVAASKTDEANLLFSHLKSSLSGNTENIKNIFETHMTNKNGKYMVFCRNIEDMNKKIAEAQELFAKVNPNMQIYKVSSALDDIRDNEKTLTEFENNQSPDTLKLMFSVNMLNEGYHLPDVDGVIMMRPTQSPTIYQQQMGRALTVGNAEGKRPVIIDLVDNFDSIRIIEDFAERMKQYQDGSARDEISNPKADDKVTVFDYVKDTNEIVKKIEKLSRVHSLTFDEKLELFSKFKADPATDGDIRGDTIYEGYPIGSYYVQMRHEINVGKGNYTEEQIARLNELRLFG